MGKFFDQDNPLMRGLSKIFDLGFLSIIWLLACIPVITIGAATTALYYTTVKVIRKERGYIFEQFKNAFKQNFINATLLWLGILSILVVFLINYLIIGQSQMEQGAYLVGVYIVFVVLTLIVGMYMFPVLSRFDMKKTKIMRLSFYMAFRHLPSTIVLFAILAAALFGLFWGFFIPVLLLIVPAASCLLFSFIMERLLRIYTPKQETQYTEDGQEIKEWYMD